MDQSFKRFKKILQELAPLSDGQTEDFFYSLKKTSYKKDSFFSRPETPSTCIGFVDEGLLRVYKIDRNGKEHTKAFVGENMFISSYSAIMYNAMSIVYMQALEDCVIYQLQRTDFLRLLEQHVVYRILLQKATEQDYLRVEKRETDFLMLNAENRYINFLNDFPQFINRIQQQYIASYLGISPETLCRIRTNLS